MKSNNIHHINMHGIAYENVLPEQLLAVFKEVFHTYYTPLIFFAEKIIHNKEAAADIVADVFIKLFAKQPDFNQYQNIKAVLYISVKNACLNYIKQHKRNAGKQHAFAYYIKEESEDFILNQIIRTEVIREIYAELEKLPLEQRRVMHLLFKEGLDTKQAAEQLNISVHTVKKHKLNAIRTLKKTFRVTTKLLLLMLVCL